VHKVSVNPSLKIAFTIQHGVLWGDTWSGRTAWHLP